MRDAAAVFALQQLFHRLHRQGRGAFLEQLHACGGSGKMAQPVEAFCVHGLAGVRRRGQNGMAMGNARPLHQPVKDGNAAIVAGQHGAGKAQERRMHVMGRHGSGDAVDKGVGHGHPSLTSHVEGR